FKSIRWGESLQGLRFGLRMKDEPQTKDREPIVIDWSKSKAVTLKPEYYLWNATNSRVEISMLHHTPLDWSHRITNDVGTELGPHPILTGPKTEEKRQLKPNEIVQVGEG